jgi:hypothetical protein
MAQLRGKMLICLWLAASFIAACSAAAVAEPAVSSKASSLNSAVQPVDAEDVGVSKGSEKQRESHALRSDTASYTSYITAPASVPVQAAAPLPAPAPTSAAALPAVSAAAASTSLYPALQRQPTSQNQQPLPVPIYSNPQDTTMGYVYYYLPQAEKYYPKLKDLIPYIRSFSPFMARAWPTMRQVADRTFDIGSALGLVVLAPALLISSVLFLIFIVFLLAFPAVSAFGKRRMGRDLSGLEDPDQLFDFDQFLPAEQSRKLATLAARVEQMLESYMVALKSDSCLERVSCEAGHISNRFGDRIGRISEPIVK